MGPAQPDPPARHASSTLWCLTVACHVDNETRLLTFKSPMAHDPSGLLQNWKSGSPAQTAATGPVSSASPKTGSRLSRPRAHREKKNSFLSDTILHALLKLQDLGGIFLLNLRNITSPFRISFSVAETWDCLHRPASHRDIGKLVGSSFPISSLNLYTFFNIINKYIYFEISIEITYRFVMLNCFSTKYFFVLEVFVL